MIFRIKLGLLSIFLLLCSSCLPRGSSQSYISGEGTQLSPGVRDAVEMFRIVLPNNPKNQTPDNVEQSLKRYAFTVLTESGKQIFLRAVKYRDIHKAIRKDNKAAYKFTEPLSCALNVYQVMWVNPLDSLNTSTNRNARSLRQLEAKIRGEGGVVVNIPFPKHYPCPGNTPSHMCSKPIIEDLDNGPISFFNEPNLYAKLPPGFFDKGIPPGIIVLGYEVNADYAESGHSAIVGDVNESGTIMLYHNNWWRPENSTQGMRHAGMVSINNLYHGHRKPRQWMATKWLYFQRDPEHGKIVKIHSITPGIDDLDPLNSRYRIALAIPASIINDFQNNKFVSHNRTKYIDDEDNIHHISRDLESNQKICRLNIDPRGNNPKALKEFFDEYALKERIPKEWKTILDTDNHPDNQETLMELYVHQAGNPEGYKQVTFYKAHNQKWFGLYVRDDAFSQRTSALAHDGTPIFDNKIYCTTKQKMEEDNGKIHAVLKQF